MSKQRKKKFHLTTISTLIVLAIFLAYPSAKKLLSMTKTYSHPVEYGKEIIYSYINEGDIGIADQILNNNYEISRFDPVKIEELTWREDPYSDIYWRFNFYNLESVRNLLFAWLETEQPKYKNKLIQITESFIDDGLDGPYSWDYHGVAFRTMTLINVRAKLQQSGNLPAALDKKIQQTLKTHGEFLADPAHFEKSYNHGLDQAAALYLLAINYPDLPGADEWLSLSSKRIVIVLAGMIDEDGILVENSPYYHLYVLEKFFEINKYLDQNDLVIKGFSTNSIDKMVSYVVHMLQPDLNVPTIGASIQRQIGLSGLYKELAGSRPDLLYVLTKGAYGEKPTKLNVHYPSSGQTIMRSGWGQKKNFENQTQLIFDVGNYRTNHSDLDALSFSLYGKGIALMPDAGIFNYNSQPNRSYFHGTRSHNTVIVDGNDQSEGNILSSNKVTPGFFQEGEGYVYQSAQSNLYEGVTHKRAIMMIDDSTIIVIDDLESDSEHSYEQLFHLFPEAKVTTDGLNITALGNNPEQSLSITQYVTAGLELNTAIGKQDPPDGLCSTEYNVAVPCRKISYAQTGKNISFVTAISIGNKADIIYEKDDNLLKVLTSRSDYNVKINETEHRDRIIEVDKKDDLSEIFSDAQQADSLNEFNQWQHAYEEDSIGYGGLVSFDSENNSLKINTPSDGTNFEAIKDSRLDLTNRNIYFKIMVENSTDLRSLDIYLSNNNWAKEAVLYALGSTYDVDRSGEWMQFGAGKSKLRNPALGGWILRDPTFDWSKVDSIKFLVQSFQGENAVINIKDFKLVPDQEKGRVVIVFDDGWSSVIDAAEIMNEHRLKGNVAVITGSVDKKQYLTLDELKMLQNEYGWDMVNHSNFHKNAVKEYVNNNDLGGLDVDVADGLQFLIQNDINSAPNWYIYPNGSTDESVKNIIGKYYTFARVTNNIPETFPFSDPLEVGVFSVYTDRATPIDIHNAISDAIEYNHTLFLMFHKFSREEPDVYTEISLDEFDEILNDINEQGIKVVTLSELDQENGIPQPQINLQNSEPSQITLEVDKNKGISGFIYAILNR